MVLVYYNSVDNEYQRNSKVLCTFLSDWAFGKLITDWLSAKCNFSKNI